MNNPDSWVISGNQWGPRNQNDLLTWSTPTRLPDIHKEEAYRVYLPNKGLDQKPEALSTLQSSPCTLTESGVHNLMPEKEGHGKLGG